MRFGVLLPVLLLAACGQGYNQASKPPAPVDSAASVDVSDVKLPPSIVASKSFRCKDNSVLLVDFLSDGRSANVSPSRDKASVHVEAKSDSEAMTGGGWTLKGGKGDANVTVTAPGSSKEVSCHTGPQAD